MTWGAIREEALKHIREVVEMVVAELVEDGEPLPAGTTTSDEPYLFGRLRVNGPDPKHRSYRSYASFSDPDGNGWLLQEVTQRLPV